MFEKINSPFFECKYVNGKVILTKSDELDNLESFLRNKDHLLPKDIKLSLEDLQIFAEDNTDI
jgi:hypothetical protein